MTRDQALSRDLWPEPFQWSNFPDVVSRSPLVRWAFNTAIYSGLATLGLLVSSIPVAYAFSRLRWKGRDTVFLLVLISMMLPPQITVVSLYILWAKLDLVGTLVPLIVPNWFGDAFSIFLLRQFFLTIPDEYLDAARVDGCGEVRILTRVVVRLAKPAIAAVALFSILFTFNDFFLPLLYAGQDPDSWVVSIGLSRFRSLHQVDWSLTMAATLIVMTPIILLFFAAQTDVRRGRHAHGRQGMTSVSGVVTLAVDGGNSKTDLALVAIDGALLAFERGPLGSPHHIGLQGSVRLLADLLQVRSAPPDWPGSDATGRRHRTPHARRARLPRGGAALPCRRRWARLGRTDHRRQRHVRGPAGRHRPWLGRRGDMRHGHQLRGHRAGRPARPLPVARHDHR